ncbi:unnamed protein product [Allacma fusca]|uniref:O-acyltransferase WSD1 C-terminal domain-containing protein n=1 Tax=Allacma fusca TaxID=39272 RepID=A0A8J2K627_9HEXA|nr:unnamed protein product [Allacma fusca]
MPKPNHPGGLTNHMIVCPFKWPIKAVSAAERIQKIQEKFNHMNKSVTTGFLFLSYFDGYPISSLHAELGLPGNTIGTSILMAGINGDQGITVTMDKRIFPFEKIFQRLGDYVERELGCLLQNNV